MLIIVRPQPGPTMFKLNWRFLTQNYQSCGSEQPLNPLMIKMGLVMTMRVLMTKMVMMTITLTMMMAGLKDYFSFVGGCTTDLILSAAEPNFDYAVIGNHQAR